MKFGDRFVLYSPLKRLAFLVNGAVIEALQTRMRKPAFRDFLPDTSDIIAFLDATGIFEDSPPPTSSCIADKFLPTTATLFLTNRCNLRCVYCYASAGERTPVTMPWEIAKKAVDYIINNALNKAEQDVQIGFHGGGEPTLAWDIMKRTVYYFRHCAATNGLTPSVHTATNGVIPRYKLDWIIENLTSANISLDGLPTIQNAQRPTAAGGSSFDAVEATIRAMDAGKFDYGVRATVTKQSVTEMGNLTYYLAENSRCRQIHFEPVFNCGRCFHSGADGPSAAEFIEGFKSSCAAATKRPIEVLYSGARFYTLTDKFCHAAGESFCVTPTGDVTSCYEVITSEDPRSDIFFYGAYDAPTGEFKIFDKKLKRLRERTVAKIEYCQNCFCKYHCAGDCLTRATDGVHLTNIMDTARCRINQDLTLDQIIRKLSE